MKHLISTLFFCLFSAFCLNAQQVIQMGKGSYAQHPPDSVVYEDGYFAAPYNWFEQAWPELNLHENARNKPIPTNDWWTEFIFRGLGRVQPEYHKPPVTVTTTGNRFGCEAWAYPQMITASAEGFNIFYPKGFSGGGMVKGNPLKINATITLQANDENVLFTDFESSSWPVGWTVSNNTQNIPGPMATSEITQSPKPSGYVGNRFVNTYKGDGAQITLVSPKFTIEKDYIRLYVGGGNYPDAAYVGLFINGTRVKSETGNQGASITQRTWNVTEYKGQQAEIRIVDATGGGWGFIMCDEIIFTNSQFGGSGYTPEFKTTSAKVYDWTDLGFTLRSENAGKYMDATMIHGVPFVYVEMKDLYPIITPGGVAVVYDLSGNKITDFPVSVNAFSIEYDNRVFGVHAPLGSKIHQSKGGDFQIETPAGKRYVVVSALPDKSFLSTYDQYARNKPGNIIFDYEYKVAEGKIVTTFNMDARNLETGAVNQEVLMSFLPHHYRNTTQNFTFINGAEYQMFIGKMKTAAEKSFSISYNFGGIPPYMPEPLNMTEERKSMMNSLLDYSSTHFGRNGNTYAKGLGEQTTMMLMSKCLEHKGFDLFRKGLKTELTDWFTFDESEKIKKSYYFAEYPKYGAVIGFPPGYGSQGFNDLHFHNGYFTVGAARLMMVDNEFKRDFAEMTKLVTKTYANWDHYKNENDKYIPFLRTFDPYLGHSFAGGTGDGGGNNQESTSEAINSWFGIYLMGVELNEKKIIDTGAMGYLLENLTAGEYWLDMYKENFPSTYGRQYVGILRTDNLAWATYFAGDPAWVLGIQACPVDFYYRDFCINPERMKEINTAMFHDRTTFIYDGLPMHTNDDPYDNIKTMGPYLGGYHLNIMNYINPETAAQWVDDFCRLPDKAGQDWRNHLNTTTNYYMSNAMITYGNPAPGYHTSIPSGAVYQNAKGELTYLLYNATDADVDVDIYRNGTKIETIKVGAKVYYNSKLSGGIKPKVTITSHQSDGKLALNSATKLTAIASDKDGRVLWVKFYIDNELVGTSYAEPYEIFTTVTSLGAKVLKAVAFDNEGNESEPSIVNLNVVEQKPYNNRQPWAIPNETIYAVQFDDGGPEVACHDNELEMKGGTNYRPDTGVETEGTSNIANSNIGWTNTGEWFEYTINVQTDGVYAMNANLGSNAGGALRIFIDDRDMTGAVTVPKGTGWTRFDMFVANISMKQGKHVMRVMIDKTGANLNSFKFTLTTDVMPSEVNAGEDQVILYPENTSTTLTATPVTYGTATITKYEWRQTDANAFVTIVSPDQATTVVSGLQLGTYTFDCTITDSNEKTATDQVVIVVRPDNFSPMAIPGNDRSVNVGSELILDGSKSVDSDGTIVKYEWKQIDANTSVIISNSSSAITSVTGLETGKLYIFQLTVTDNKGATTSSNLRISVLGGTYINKISDNQISIYPNPFVDQLIVQTEGQFEKLRLHSVTGNIVLDENIQGQLVYSLNTSRLKQGYYILSLISKSGIVSRRVVKK